MLHLLAPSKVFEDQVQMTKRKDEEIKEESEHIDKREQAPNICIQDKRKEERVMLLITSLMR